MAHPWHSSSGELQWNAEEGVFELALEMDAYHLEEAMSRGVDGWVDLESERAPAMLESMLDEGFRVWTRAVPEDGARPGQWELATPEFIGHEIDDGSAWMYVAFTPEGAGEGRIEAMVRNVFMRGPLPELAVTVRVSGGEPREPATEDEPLPPGAARGAEVLNFVKADAMAGFRPKQVGVVFRYGLTSEGLERRQVLYMSRAIARAKLGDAREFVLEAARAEAYAAGTERSRAYGDAVVRGQTEAIEALFESWRRAADAGEPREGIIAAFVVTGDAIVFAHIEPSADVESLVIVEGQQLEALYARLQEVASPLLDLATEPDPTRFADYIAIARTLGVWGLVSRAGSVEVGHSILVGDDRDRELLVAQAVMAGGFAVQALREAGELPGEPDLKED
jgi:hypothetical protein